jgi:zinc/manganese transport system permease protein
MLSHPFAVNALIAGIPTGACCGATGYILVIRRQVFTGDALSHAAFAGPLAALAAGVDLRFGLFAATILVAVAMGVLGRQGKADDVVIGSVFVWVLGLGVLFLSIYTRSTSGANGTAGVSVLFGSAFGLSRSDAFLSSSICVTVLVALTAIARPLLFSSIDGPVAAAAGVPVSALGIAFLAIVGLVAAETTQAVGALLLLGLLAGPGAAARNLSDRPLTGLALGALVGAAVVGGGLWLSYVIAKLPPSFAIISLATAVYAGSSAMRIRRSLGPARMAGQLS